MSFADSLRRFRDESHADPFAPLAESALEYERYLDSTPPMTEDEEAAYARAYAESECASQRFAYAYPYLDD